jgi:hypothetical protein
MRDYRTITCLFGPAKLFFLSRDVRRAQLPQEVMVIERRRLEDPETQWRQKHGCAINVPARCFSPQSFTNNRAGRSQH